MLSVISQKKEGFRFYFVLKDGKGEYGGGLTEEGLLVADAACPQKELMLRTLVNKCMNDFVPRAAARDEWGLDLTRFGFLREGALFVASMDTFRLPHDCGH